MANTITDLSGKTIAELAEQVEAAEPLIVFPTVFPIKVMGETQVDFAQTMVVLIQTFAPNFAEKDVEHRASSGGKYTSLTCNVLVDSQAQLDDIYRAVSAHPLVKFAL